jgi:methionyl aminopeptidase
MSTTLEEIIQKLSEKTVVGATGLQLEDLAKTLLNEAGAEPAFLGFKDYPNVICVSINSELIHGIPDDRPFQDGDVVKIDIGLKKDGQFDDGATTVIVGGQGSKLARKLVKATKEALEAGCQCARAGYTTNDIGRAVHSTAVKYGMAVIEGYGGHGIGAELHLPPFVPNYGIDTPVRLETGMRLAIEPMLSTRDGLTFVGENKWTILLKHKGLAAHFERTVTVSG